MTVAASQDPNAARYALDAPQRLATHVTLVHRAGWLVSMLGWFLDAPMPEAE